MVVDKPAGLLSVPGKGAEKADCVAARVRAAFPGASGPMVVHRLDMDTSGLIVLGLDEGAQRELSRQFEARQVEKRYVALLDGSLQNDEGEIDLPIRPDVEHRPYQMVDFVHGRRAVTRYRVLAREAGWTRVEFSPITGRAHQLRIHAADPKYVGPPGGAVRVVGDEEGVPRGLGCPIVGDVLYGDGASGPRLMLHAAYLSFVDPETGGRVEYSSGAPF